MKTRSTLTMLPDWACTAISEDYILAALGGREIMRKEAFTDICNYYGVAL